MVRAPDISPTATPSTPGNFQPSVTLTPGDLTPLASKATCTHKDTHTHIQLKIMMNILKDIS